MMVRNIKFLFHSAIFTLTSQDDSGTESENILSEKAASKKGSLKCTFIHAENIFYRDYAEAYSNGKPG
jgi:hypothetical protein